MISLGVAISGSVDTGPPLLHSCYAYILGYNLVQVFGQAPQEGHEGPAIYFDSVVIPLHDCWFALHRNLELGGSSSFLLMGHPLCWWKHPSWLSSSRNSNPKTHGRNSSSSPVGTSKAYNNNWWKRRPWILRRVWRALWESLKRENRKEKCNWNIISKRLSNSYYFPFVLEIFCFLIFTYLSFKVILYTLVQDTYHILKNDFLPPPS